MREVCPLQPREEGIETEVVRARGKNTDCRGRLLLLEIFLVEDSQEKEISSLVLAVSLSRYGEGRRDRERSNIWAGRGSNRAYNRLK